MDEIFFLLLMDTSWPSNVGSYGKGNLDFHGSQDVMDGSLSLSLVTLQRPHPEQQPRLLS